MKLIDKAKEDIRRFDLPQQCLTESEIYLVQVSAALVAATEALGQWSEGEDHADKGELASAAVHYDEAVKLTVAALALAHKEVQ